MTQKEFSEKQVGDGLELEGIVEGEKFPEIEQILGNLRILLDEIAVTTKTEEIDQNTLDNVLNVIDKETNKDVKPKNQSRNRKIFKDLYGLEKAIIRTQRDLSREIYLDSGAISKISTRTKIKLKKVLLVKYAHLFQEKELEKLNLTPLIEKNYTTLLQLLRITTNQHPIEFIPLVYAMIFSYDGALQTRSERNSEIFCGYYGLSQEEKMTQPALAEKFKTDNANINRILKKLADWLKKELIQNYPNLFFDCDNYQVTADSLVEETLVTSDLNHERETQGLEETMKILMEENERLIQGEKLYLKERDDLESQAIEQSERVDKQLQDIQELKSQITELKEKIQGLEKLILIREEENQELDKRLKNLKTRESDFNVSQDLSVEANAKIAELEGSIKTLTLELKREKDLVKKLQQELSSKKQQKNVTIKNPDSSKEAENNSELKTEIRRLKKLIEESNIKKMGSKIEGLAQELILKDELITVETRTTEELRRQNKFLKAEIERFQTLQAQIETPLTQEQPSQKADELGKVLDINNLGDVLDNAILKHIGQKERMQIKDVDYLVLKNKILLELIQTVITGKPKQASELLFSKIQYFVNEVAELSVENQRLKGRIK